jgi:predicted nucleic acid-binding protein
MSARDLDVALGTAERVLLDSSTLIAFHSPHERAHPLAQHLLRRIEDPSDPLRGYFSVMSAMELLIRPIRTGMQEFTFMHTFLSSYPNLTALPMDLTVALQAATVRATTGIRAPDAVIIASALLTGCEAIVCNDQQWIARLRALFPQFSWVYLAAFVP